MTIIHQTLLAVRELLAAPERWTKGTHARDAAGLATEPTEKLRLRGHGLAVCWCLDGALLRVTGHDGKFGSYASELYSSCRKVLRGQLNGGQEFLSAWQDRTEVTHPELLALLDRALEETKPR